MGLQCASLKAQCGECKQIGECKPLGVCCKDGSTADSQMVKVNSQPSRAGFSSPSRDPFLGANVVARNGDIHYKMVGAGMVSEKRGGSVTPVPSSPSSSYDNLQVPPGALPDRPTNRTWRDEWVQVRMEELVLQGQEHRARREDFEDGGSASIDKMLQHLSSYIYWQVKQGWRRDHAEAYTILVSCGRAAMSRALRENSPVYAASQHLVFDVLCTRAKALKEPAPLAYRNLTGKYCLTSEDPVWSLLNQDVLEIGTTFTTTAIVAGYSGRASNFKDELGFYITAYRGGKTTHELQNSDVVCFTSTMKDANGFHSLIPTASCTYDLPPTAMVKLESIKEPGTWKVDEKFIQRRLLVVTVTYGPCSL
eukprot:gnl/TRDRNA2_/TRDRNA2_199616_c0_seq1.p1 gnl/TRDRNA2_/TRDRNA2_199616_c0~~gnl/TRDRNA2_/TRDRNA2_199616_c0_seq1.p1  ORF type:complete len:365 (-),score=36.85 gnl/TRDRNA2_/TRDRNA2_199616_c0_seq1:97-1191(-)